MVTYVTLHVGDGDEPTAKFLRPDLVALRGGDFTMFGSPDRLRSWIEQAGDTLAMAELAEAEKAFDSLFGAVHTLGPDVAAENVMGGALIDDRRLSEFPCRVLEREELWRDGEQRVRLRLRGEGRPGEATEWTVDLHASTLLNVAYLTPTGKAS